MVHKYEEILSKNPGMAKSHLCVHLSNTTKAKSKNMSTSIGEYTHSSWNTVKNLIKDKKIIAVEEGRTIKLYLPNQLINSYEVGEQNMDKYEKIDKIFIKLTKTIGEALDSKSELRLIYDTESIKRNIIKNIRHALFLADEGYFNHMIERNRK